MLLVWIDFMAHLPGKPIYFSSRTRMVGALNIAGLPLASTSSKRHALFARNPIGQEEKTLDLRLCRWFGARKVQRRKIYLHCYWHFMVFPFWPASFPVLGCIPLRGALVGFDFQWTHQAWRSLSSHCGWTSNRTTVEWSCKLRRNTSC